ncbi:hypothetical protein, partial [Aquabacterium sp.]|uniref:hypothetical protein n=1 Tax=Aquabacterium sp. TaxID=1872578 RepID=UPI0025BE5DD9
LLENPRPRDRKVRGLLLFQITTPMTPHTSNFNGNAGRRMRADISASIPDDLLRDFAREHLGAQRPNTGYLSSLRIVLGNQAHAERTGHTLEMNIRSEAGSERTMRTIIDQMKHAGITERRMVFLGQGRKQEVQCYVPAPLPRVSLNSYLRVEEARLEAGRRCAALASSVPDVIELGDIPF